MAAERHLGYSKMAINLQPIYAVLATAGLYIEVSFL